MTVTRYLFQSPYSSQVQIGTPDPSSKEEETSKSKSSFGSAATAKTPEQWLQNDAITVQKVEPTVETNKLLDTYA
ncbi:hypothetical protein [Sulfurimonas sp.]